MLVLLAWCFGFLLVLKYYKNQPQTTTFVTATAFMRLWVYTGKSAVSIITVHALSSWAPAEPATADYGADWRVHSPQGRAQASLKEQ